MNLKKGTFLEGKGFISKRLFYISDCHKDNTYTIRTIFDDRFVGRLTIQEIDKLYEIIEEV